jgi:hypothetical protein
VQEYEKLTNFLEVRAFGLMRNGNHAILDWVLGQHAGKKTCFLNNVRHGDHDPFRTCEKIVLRNIKKELNVEALRRLPKRLLIYSYEDRKDTIPRSDFISSVFDGAFEVKREYYFGTSKIRINLLIIRDPFNSIASRIKLFEKQGNLGGIDDLELILSNWKILARKALEAEQSEDSDIVVANYNRWVVDPLYRARLSKLLKGSSDDSSMNRVADFGAGSSFDARRWSATEISHNWRKLFIPKKYLNLKTYFQRLLAPKPSEMRVFERWRMLSDNQTFRSIVSDPEVIELSEALFGEITGTRTWVTGSD